MQKLVNEDGGSDVSSPSSSASSTSSLTSTDLDIELSEQPDSSRTSDDGNEHVVPLCQEEDSKCEEECGSKGPELNTTAECDKENHPTNCQEENFNAAEEHVAQVEAEAVFPPPFAYLPMSWPMTPIFEEDEHKTRDDAVLKVQRAWRIRQSARCCTNIRKATRKLQTHRRLVVAVRRERAALQLQKIYRGRRARRAFQQLAKAVVRLQRWFRKCLKAKRGTEVADASSRELAAESQARPRRAQESHGLPPKAIQRLDHIRRTMEDALARLGSVDPDKLDLADTSVSDAIMSVERISRTLRCKVEGIDRGSSAEPATFSALPRITTTLSDERFPTEELDEEIVSHWKQVPRQFQHTPFHLSSNSDVGETWL